MEEVHITVEGHPVLWWQFCNKFGFKPLFIYLNNHQTQLMMCVERYDDSVKVALDYNGWEAIRVKHEVHPNSIPAGVTPLYYECHLKIDGKFDPLMPMASRDLYRPNRWYLTMRQRSPFDPARLTQFARAIHPDLNIVDVEYEACLSDTNEALDDGWR